MEFEFDYNDKALESADKDEFKLINPPNMYKSKSDVKDNNKVRNLEILTENDEV